jgi:hypothetical protein
MATVAPAPTTLAAPPESLPSILAATPRPIRRATPVPAATAPPDSVPTASETHSAPSTLSPAPAVGFLQVGVTPWADVAVDGQLVGQTPMRPLSLAPGMHDVLLSHPDFQPFPRRVTIRPGETLRLIVDLTSDGVRRPR